MVGGGSGSAAMEDEEEDGEGASNMLRAEGLPDLTFEVAAGEHRLAKAWEENESLMVVHDREASRGATWQPLPPPPASSSDVAAATGDRATLLNYLLGASAQAQLLRTENASVPNSRVLVQDDEVLAAVATMADGAHSPGPVRSLHHVLGYVDEGRKFASMARVAEAVLRDDAGVAEANRT